MAAQSLAMGSAHACPAKPWRSGVSRATFGVSPNACTVQPPYWRHIFCISPLPVQPRPTKIYGGRSASRSRKIVKASQGKSRVFSSKKFAIFYPANFSKYWANPHKNAQKTPQICPQKVAVYEMVAIIPIFHQRTRVHPSRTMRDAWLKILKVTKGELRVLTPGGGGPPGLGIESRESVITQTIATTLLGPI